MNPVVARTWLVYFFTLLSVGMLNIDGVLSWYGNSGEGREGISLGLAELKRVQQETGIGAWLDRVECAAGFAFEGTYKDKSKCQVHAVVWPSVSSEVMAADGSDWEHNPERGLRPDTGSQSGKGLHGRTDSAFRVQPEMKHEPRAASGDQQILESRSQSAARHSNGNGPETPGHARNDLASAHESWPGFQPPAASSGGWAGTSEDSGAAPPPDSERLGSELALARSHRPSDPVGPPSARGAVEESARMAIQLASVREERETSPAGCLTSDHAPGGEEVGKTKFHSVLLVGDSLAHGLAMAMERDLKAREGVTFSYLAKVSSGLTSPNVLNWEKTARMLIEKETPDLVLIMMGVNDANNHIRDGKQLHQVGTAEWAEAYEGKIESFLRVVSAGRARVCWIGVPVVREEWLQNRVLMANLAARKACGKVANCYFIDTVEALCDEHQKYTNYLREPNGSNVRIRAKDGIHFSMAGSSLLSRHVLSKLQDRDNGSSGVRN
jgi:hypothetical protein